MIKYAKPFILFDAGTVQTDLSSFNQAWQPHFNTFNYEGEWTGLPLRSPEGDHKTIVPDLLGQSQYGDTIYFKYFGSVKKLLCGLHCETLSVRFLNLKAGAVIKQHTDHHLSLEQGEARLHFPVFTNPGVEFYVDNERIMMNEGECWYINANLPHRVTNHGNTDRVHLVVDCKVNDWLKDTINASKEIAFKKDCPNKANKPENERLIIIKELRLQNTATSNRIATELEKQLK